MTKKSLFTLALALTSFASSANELSYDYVEGGVARHYATTSFPSERDPLKGGYVRGSFALNDVVYVYGGFARTSRDELISFELNYSNYRVDFDDSLIQLGLGARHPLSDHTDVLVELAYIRDDWQHTIHTPTGSLREKRDGAGGRLNLGLREVFSNRVEGWLKVGYLSLDRDFDRYSDNSHGEFIGEVGGQIRITPRWGVVAEAQFLHKITTYQLGVRSNF